MMTDTSEASYAVGPGQEKQEPASRRGTWVLDDDLTAMQRCYAQARSVVRAFRGHGQGSTAPNLMQVLEALSQACGMGPLFEARAAATPEPPPKSNAYPSVHDTFINVLRHGSPPFPAGPQAKLIALWSLSRAQDHLLSVIRETLGRTDADIIQDMLARKEFGLKKYGTTLQPFNGRDAKNDALQELLDALVYLEQALQEELLKEGKICP